MDRTALLPAVLALVGTLVGYGIAEASRAPGVSPASPPALTKPVAPGSAARSDDSALVLELRALGDRIEAAVARGGGARTAIEEGSRIDEERLVALLERCTDLIARLERSSAVGSARSLDLTNPHGSREALIASDRSSPESRAALDRRHLLMSYQQVLDLYGKPDQVRALSEEVQWIYQYEGSDGKQYDRRIKFLDGLVYKVI